MSFGGMTIKNTPAVRAVLYNSDLSIFEGVPAPGPPAGNAVRETIKLGSVEDCLQKWLQFFPSLYFPL